MISVLGLPRTNYEVLYEGIGGGALGQEWVERTLQVGFRTCRDKPEFDKVIPKLTSKKLIVQLRFNDSKLI